MVFCGESIITEISVYVFFYMSEFIIQSTSEKNMKNSENGVTKTRVMWYHIELKIDKIKHGLPCFSLHNRPFRHVMKGIQ